MRMLVFTLPVVLSEGGQKGKPDQYLNPIVD